MLSFCKLDPAGDVPLLNRHPWGLMDSEMLLGSLPHSVEAFVAVSDSSFQ